MKRGQRTKDEKRSVCLLFNRSTLELDCRVGRVGRTNKQANISSSSSKGRKAIQGLSSMNIQPAGR